MSDLLAILKNIDKLDNPSTEFLKELCKHAACEIEQIKAESREAACEIELLEAERREDDDR